MFLLRKFAFVCSERITTMRWKLWWIRYYQCWCWISLMSRFELLKNLLKHFKIRNVHVLRTCVSYRNFRTYRNWWKKLPFFNIVSKFEIDKYCEYCFKIRNTFGDISKHFRQYIETLWYQQFFGLPVCLFCFAFD